MQPAFFVHHLFGGFFILVVTQHGIGTAANNLTGDVLWVGREDFHFHAGSCLTARTGFEACPILVADDGATFRHAVTYCVGEVYHAQELFHFLIEGRTAYNDCRKITAEGLYHLFAYGGFYLVVDDRHFQQQFHGGRFQLGQYALLDDLFDDERYGHNEVGLHVGKGLEDDLRAWHAGEVIDVATHRKLIQELKCKSVHVCHWQHAYQLVTGFQRQHFKGEFGVGPQAAIGEHDAFRVAGCAGGIVDDRQFFGLVFVIVDMLFAEVLGEFLAEHLIEVLAGIGDTFVTRHEQGEVRHHENAFQQGHGAFIEVFPYLVSYEKELGFGVIDDVVHIVRLELVKNGYDDRAISQRGEECYSPV